MRVMGESHPLVGAHHGQAPCGAYAFLRIHTTPLRARLCKAPILWMQTPRPQQSNIMPKAIGLGGLESGLDSGHL